MVIPSEDFIELRKMANELVELCKGTPAHSQAIELCNKLIDLEDAQ